MNITFCFEGDMDPGLLVVGNRSLIATEPTHPKKAIVLLGAERDDYAGNAEGFLDSQRCEGGIEECAFRVEECVRAVEEEVVDGHGSGGFVGGWEIRMMKGHWHLSNLRYFYIRKWS